MAILVERKIIGIFGKMNAGKSSVMNLLTQSPTSIVDSTPGTTADTKVALFELHGLGPVRILDTAGADEAGDLGRKKREKIFADLSQCDLALLVMDPSTADFSAEEEILKKAREQDRQILAVYNLFSDQQNGAIPEIEEALPLLRFYPKIQGKANDPGFRSTLLEFILAHFVSSAESMDLLPFVQKDQFYILAIPMDDETPPGRLLRPQAMVEEHITRKWAYPISFRLDLKKARGNEKEKEEEKSRFLRLIHGMGQPPVAVITDSQAMDVMTSWCPANVMLTTFSIVMIQYFSRGRLAEFIRGIQELEQLKPGDRILIVEACNHSRIGEDIGTVQIPRILAEKFPGVIVEHCFGREFEENTRLRDYRLMIHCGGCMISQQKMASRIRDLVSLGVPYTNYGVFLSYMQGKEALKRVVSPFGVRIK